MAKTSTTRQRMTAVMTMANTSMRQRTCHSTRPLHTAALHSSPPLPPQRTELRRRSFSLLRVVRRTIPTSRLPPARPIPNPHTRLPQVLRALAVAKALLPLPSRNRTARTVNRIPNNPLSEPHPTLLRRMPPLPHRLTKRQCHPILQPLTGLHIKLPPRVLIPQVPIRPQQRVPTPQAPLVALHHGYPPPACRSSDAINKRIPYLYFECL